MQAQLADAEARLSDAEATIEEMTQDRESVEKKIEDIAVVMRAVADGEITRKIDFKSDDAIGRLGGTINDMTASLRLMADAAERIAAGDLTAEMKAKSEKDMLGNSFVKMLSSLSRMIAQSRVSADSIASAAEQVAAGNEDLSQRTEEQASSLEETASSMEEMTSTVKQNADSSRQATQLAVQAREVAEKGGQVVGNAVSSMNEINKASKRSSRIGGTPAHVPRSGSERGALFG